MLKLYGTPPTRVLRAMRLMNELGLEYEHHPVEMLHGEHHRPEFLALNPAGKVPVLVDGDFVLTESVAIQLYLAGAYLDERTQRRRCRCTPGDIRSGDAHHVIPLA